ncbi:hypothetical protein Q4E40_14150 [Pontibacter sp. BT731]|uniref:hypothetical protein n=1 Tax=Pontibacter coccineus TaxID=3063328 RepID=UPI0026E1B9D4|nr:hypothetical protein [Pontibacter sp. BT731]MDO6391278.1 hypothetical protein [Pontibacter sp. BT731]
MEQTFSSFLTGLGLISIIIGIVLLVFAVWSVIWSYHDARRRGKSPWLVALMVLLMVWPVGLIIWLLLRPQKTEQQV